MLVWDCFERYWDKFLTWISLHLPKEALNALHKIQFTIGTNFWNTLYSLIYVHFVTNAKMFSQSISLFMFCFLFCYRCSPLCIVICMRQGGNKNIEEGKKTLRKENNKIVEEEGNKNEKGEGKYNILRSVKRKKDGLPSRILNLIFLQFFE